MKLIQVKQFNIQQDKKYREAINKYEFGKGGFPFRPMYVFQTENGEDRKRGWVATDEKKHSFGMNPQKAKLNFNAI